MSSSHSNKPSKSGVYPAHIINSTPHLDSKPDKEIIGSELPVRTLYNNNQALPLALNVFLDSS